MSKIHSIKQQKRYRNQTMNVLYHLNTKTTTPTINDKSLRSFKANKQQEVQSSRLSTRVGTSVNMRKRATNSRSRQQPTRIQTQHVPYQQRNIDKNSSKSLSSRNGKVYDADKTKKNSYSKFHTEMNGAKSIVNWDSIVEQHFQKRLKRLQNIFSSQKDEKQGKQWQYSHRSSNPKKDKHGRSNSFTGIPGTKNLRSSPKQQKFQHLLQKMLGKFLLFQNLMQDRRISMVFDDFDKIITNIFQNIKQDFGTIIDAVLKQNQQKFTDICITIQNIQLQNQRKMQEQKQNYKQQIEQLLTRSLFVTDSINELQKNGIINFEAQVRDINQRYLQQIRQKQLLQINLREQTEKYYQQQQEQHYNNNNKSLAIMNLHPVQKSIEDNRINSHRPQPLKHKYTSDEQQSLQSQQLENCISRINYSQYNKECEYPKLTQKVFNKKIYKKNMENRINTQVIQNNSSTHLGAVYLQEQKKKKNYSPILIKEGNQSWNYFDY